MKRVHISRAFLPCALSLALLGPLRCFALDEVDQLLRGESIAVPSEPLLPNVLGSADPFAGDGLADVHATVVSDQARWTPPAENVPLAAPAPNSSVLNVEPKSTTGSRVDLVPEPSALAMAAFALLFFLLLGHRRRLG